MAKSNKPVANTEEKKTEKMTTEKAEAIVHKYSGFNGWHVPDELKAAKAFLREQA